MKLKEFQKEMKKRGVGLSLFFNIDGDNIDPNFLYFTQYTGFGVLAITTKTAVLIVPKAEAERAKKTSRIRITIAKDKLLASLRQAIRSRPGIVGIDKNRVSVNLYKKIRKDVKARFTDISNICLRLRATKTKEEIEIIRTACKITDDIIHNTLWNFKRFNTESDVSAFLINETIKRGLTTSFKPIVASGKNACEAHHEPQNTKLQKGFCIIDFGIRYKGYCSDISRTVYIGTPTTEEIELYHKVLDVQTTLIGRCRPNKSFIEIQEEAHKLLGEHSQYFTHLIGHGVGTEIHENPNPKMTPRRPITKLLENSIVTIEPGVYFPGKRGIRIEDDVLITRDGPEVLTKTGKNLLIIKR